MELKFVIPNTEKTFGSLEFAGGDNTEQRRINGHMSVLTRSFNLYSDAQRAEQLLNEALEDYRLPENLNVFMPDSLYNDISGINPA